MGTQQILLIVLSVIVVGVAITTGLAIYRDQAIRNNRTACIQDMNRFASEAKAWWITPESMGGGGRVQYLSGGGGDWTNYIDKLGLYLGNSFNTQGNTMETLNGTYTILYGGKNAVKFKATGNEYNNGRPIEIDLIYNFSADTLSVDILN